MEHLRPILSNGVTGRYPAHRHRLHQACPTLLSPVPQVPTPPNPTHPPPHSKHSPPHVTAPASLNHTAMLWQGGAVVTLRKLSRREAMTGHRLPAFHHDPILQPPIQRPGQFFQSWAGPANLKDASCQIKLRPVGSEVWPPPAVYRLWGPCTPPTVAALELGPSPSKKNLLQLGLEGRAIPGLHGDSQEAYRGPINQEASPGGCPLLWPNASRSLVTEPRPDISTSRIFQGPSSLQAWEGWESGPQAWHLASVPLCAFATGTADE